MNSKMKHAVRALVLLACLVAIVAVPAAYAQEDASAPTDEDAPSVPTDNVENADERLWLVELESPPAAEGTSLEKLKNEKQAFRNEASEIGIRHNERYDFDTLWNGLSIELNDPADSAKFERLSTVKALYPVETVPVPKTEVVSDPEMETALAMTGADAAQSELGYTGKDVKVAVMDTGIDYQHPDLGGSFGSGTRVVTGYDFVGDEFDPTSTDPKKRVPNPDKDPDDRSGHGTHVAGIIGANGGAKGVAPDVTFGAYKVFGEGSTTADIMIAAMERALADDMDVLNMSIGAGYTSWPQYPTAKAADALVNKGVSVVASIGNEGSDGVYSVGAPGVGTKTIGVASFDNTYVHDAGRFTISPDNTNIFYGPLQSAPQPPGSGNLPIRRLPDSLTTATPDACNANVIPAGFFTGRAALIRRGGCTFYQKARNAQVRGAEAVVFYNDAPGRFASSVVPPVGSPAITKPVVGISDQEGQLIKDRLASGAVRMTWTPDKIKNLPNLTGGSISNFSSYGLTAELGLKPDIGAPGGLIRSTYPLEQGKYATISGTSMASPHVAGSVALLLQAKPKTSSQAVRSILQNSADPKPKLNQGGALDNVHRQGAGMLDIDGAITAKTKMEPGKLSLGESEAGPSTESLSIENNDSSDVTYTLSQEPALATTGSTFDPEFANKSASVSFSSDTGAIPEGGTVTIPSGGEGTVNVTITPDDELPNKSQYGGYIVLTPESGEPYRVPYAGFKGDYQSIEAETDINAGLPWLAKRNSNGSFQKQSANAKFTMSSGTEFPWILVHLDHQVRKLQVEVKEADTGTSWHRALEEEYLPRNASSTVAFGYRIDGETTSGNKEYTLPDGRYVLKVSVQKALGDDDNPDHWETWTSPAFVIDRP